MELTIALVGGLVCLLVPLSNGSRYVSSDSTYGYADVSSTTYTATGLTVGLQYYFRVAARNTIGYSGFCGLSGNTCAGVEVSVTVA